MNAFAHHLKFEFRTGIRDKQLFLMNYLFPLGFFFMMGLVMAKINPLFLENMNPAMVIFAALSAALLGLPAPLVNARENGIYRSFRINGVPSLSILIIPALTTMLHLTIVSAIITAVGALLFDAPLPVNWPGYILVFLVTAFCCAMLALLIGVISKNSRMTILWAQIIYLPSIMLGGMMFPYSMLPETAGKIAQLMPSTHAMNAFKGLAMGVAPDFSPWGSVIVLVASGAISFLLAIYLFSWDNQSFASRGKRMLALLALLPFAVGIFFFN